MCHLLPCCVPSSMLRMGYRSRVSLSRPLVGLSAFLTFSVLCVHLLSGIQLNPRKPTSLSLYLSSGNSRSSKSNEHHNVVYLLTLFLSPVSSPAKKNKPANASASPNLKASGKTINPDPKPVANGNTKDKAAEERKLEEMRAKLLKSMTERRLAKEQEQAEKKRQFSPAGRKRPAESEEFPNRSVKRAVTAPSGGLTIRGAAEAQAKAQQLTSPGRTPMDLMNRHLQGGTGNQSPVASRGRGVKNPLPDATPVDTIVKPGRAINRNGFSIAGRAMQNTLRQTQTPSPIQKRLSANPVPINERLGRNHQEQQQQKKQNQNRPWQRKSQRQSAQ
ncbi:hypothetical protein BCR43DRAFT_346871 [Syncephalastrum racemosum]|uniref:Uncharacterized protein n=1 Tax=Syncephalastrum racemosum TaxID=13706 RepID=A0A1X2H5R9_SYNRA|nr:hypothetical protein BCR43DRAFT_346871 [Syncephalastrum racemosum]